MSSTALPSLARFPEAQGLYDPALEKDSCGVGLVAHLKGKASHAVVSDANTMLVRMAHRGGCGCDPNSGDGAGILTGMPHSFLAAAVQREMGIALPPAGEYAAGNIFFPRDPELIQACKSSVEKAIAAQGLSLIGWRPLPVDNSELGPTSLESEPVTEMLLVSSRPGLSSADFNRELYAMRIAAAKEIRLPGSHRRKRRRKRGIGAPATRAHAHNLQSSPEVTINGRSKLTMRHVPSSCCVCPPKRR